MSTRCPSATPLGLALGPDLPRADEPSSGNLGSSVRGILTHVPLLTPAFSLPHAPDVLSIILPRCLERSPTTYFRKSIASVSCLAPVNFRRRVIRPVSCYALFEGVAASKPTSWLSGRTHILCHSARTWGPWRAVWAVSLSSTQLSPHALTAGVWAVGIRSSVRIGRRRSPLIDPVLYLRR